MIVEDDAAAGARPCEHQCAGRACRSSARSHPSMQLCEPLRSTSLTLRSLISHLQGQLSFPVADALAAANVPFVWLSGSSAEVLPSPYRSRPFASKPIADAGILQLIAQVLKTP